MNHYTDYLNRKVKLIQFKTNESIDMNKKNIANAKY